METIHIITDTPDPECPKCEGVGALGGCENRGHKRNPDHAHTIRFCDCVNERHVRVDA